MSAIAALLMGVLRDAHHRKYRGKDYTAKPRS
jgi:hypothetical protein